ncbi:MAG: site-specific integrase, partial [Bacteroidota bacterium]
MHFHEFLAHLRHQRRLSEHTLVAYGKDLEQFARYCEVHHDLTRAAEVTRNVVKAWLAQLMSDELAPASIRR